jgi:hypothetical protein
VFALPLLGALESHPDFFDASSLYSLEYNVIGDEGAAAIGMALRHNKTLDSLQ